MRSRLTDRDTPSARLTRWSTMATASVLHATFFSVRHSQQSATSL